MVYIEKNHLEICSRLADELNIAAKKFNQATYRRKLDRYEKILAKKDISVENKKKLIISLLHDLIVKTFSIELNNVDSQKKVLGVLKDNISALRKLVIMLRNINHYLQNTFLEELKLKKTTKLGNLKGGGIKKLIKDEALGKKDFERLEYTVYKLIEKIIFLDQRLLRRYKKKEEKIIQKSKVEVKDIEGILKKESELLCHLEAKLPPPSIIKAGLLKKPIFTEWVSRIIALIVVLEGEYKKESLIFKKLKKDKKINKNINAKIKHLIKEKWDMLKLKEKRLLSMENIKKIGAEHQIISRNYAAVLRL